MFIFFVVKFYKLKYNVLNVCLVQYIYMYMYIGNQLYMYLYIIDVFVYVCVYIYVGILKYLKVVRIFKLDSQLIVDFIW